MPKVSIIIPVYNVEKYIRRCLVSVQNQSMHDIEIIVVNDCTQDNSMTIVKELAQKDKRIRILSHERNMGPMWARKTGYNVATCDFITFCDGDDYLPPMAIEMLYLTGQDSKADIISGNYVYITVRGEKKLWKNELKYGNLRSDILKSLLRHELKHSLWAKLFNASLFRDFEYDTYANATNGEDGCLLYQVINHVNKIVQIESVVYYYMQNLESSSQIRYNENAIKSICLANKTVESIVSIYPELNADLNRYITNSLCALYVREYDQNRTHLSIHIANNRLQHYISMNNIIRYLDYKKMLSLFIRYRLFKH